MPSWEVTPSNPSTAPSIAGTSLLAVTKSKSPPSHHSGNSSIIIIAVSAGAGCLILLLAGYKLWACLARRPKVPLPPKGPLAHDRQRQMALANSRSTVLYPHTMDAIPRTLNHPSNLAQSEEQNNQTIDYDDASIPPSTPSVIGSQVRLMRTPTSSEENSDATTPQHQSFSSSSTARYPSHVRRQRTSSATGSVYIASSRHSVVGGTTRSRGPPHARHSRVDVVLPQPLAPELYYENQTLHLRQPYHQGNVEARQGRSLSLHMDAYHQSFGEYPPPIPPLPVGYNMNNAHDGLSPDSPEVVPPASAPLHPSHDSSSDRGPAPHLPTEDAPPGSHHFRSYSEPLF